MKFCPTFHYYFVGTSFAPFTCTKQLIITYPAVKGSKLRLHAVHARGGFTIWYPHCSMLWTRFLTSWKRWKYSWLTLQDWLANQHIDGFHLTLLTPCWCMFNNGVFWSTFVLCINMAAMLLVLYLLGLSENNLLSEQNNRIFIFPYLHFCTRCTCTTLKLGGTWKHIILLLIIWLTDFAHC